MKSFTDARGRPWDVTIDVAMIGRVRGALGLDLYGLIEDGAKPLGELLADPCRLVEVLYVLCRDKAEAAGLSPEDFGRLFAGDVLEDAAAAFVGALTDFFPSRQGREALTKMLAKGKELGAILLSRAVAKVDALDVQAAAESLERKLTASSGPAPGSSASTPAG